MKLQPGKLYMKPLLMGPIGDLDNLQGIDYPEVEVMGLEFAVDRAAAERVVPENFALARNPRVKLITSINRGLKDLAGGAFSGAAMFISAEHAGRTGDYNAVSFETHGWQILTGRELLGLPKVAAEVDAHKPTTEGGYRTDVSRWGELMFGVEIGPLTAADEPARAEFEAELNATPWYTYKVMPHPDKPGDPCYPLSIQNEYQVGRLWTGTTGELYFADTDYTDSIMSFVSDLIVKGPLADGTVTRAWRWTGSMVVGLHRTERLG